MQASAAPASINIDITNTLNYTNNYYVYISHVALLGLECVMPLLPGIFHEGTPIAQLFHNFAVMEARARRARIPKNRPSPFNALGMHT